MSMQRNTVLTSRYGEVAVWKRMILSDVDQVWQMERQVHAHPWSEGNFQDSLASGYEAWVLRQSETAVLAYLIMLLAVDEAHVLNVAVTAPQQGKGWGTSLLDQAAAIAREKSMASLLLEVRPSNERALGLYRHYGFVQIGMRKNYYPAGETGREDAIVMRLVL